MMNSKSLLGDEKPKGIAWLTWNVLMFVAAGVATFAAGYMLNLDLEPRLSAFLQPRLGWKVSGGWIGPAILGGVGILALLVGSIRKKS